MNQYPRVTDVFLRLDPKYQKVGGHVTRSHLQPLGHTQPFATIGSLHQHAILLMVT